MEGTSEVQEKRKRKKPRPPRGAARRTSNAHVHSHPFAVRRKAVQLCLEESFPVERVAREMGVGRSTLTKWVRLYRDQGELLGVREATHVHRHAVQGADCVP